MNRTAVHAPDHDRDPVVRMTIRIEQALLGEVLHLTNARPGDDPVGTLSRWGLHLADFLRPYHQQVYAAMLRLAAAARPAPAHAVRVELTHDRCLPAHVALDGARLTDLMAAARGGACLAAGTALVLDAATRRQAGVWSLRLAQAAVPSATESARAAVSGAGQDDHSPGGTTELLGLTTQVTAIRRELQLWRLRWSHLPRHVRDHLRPTTPDPRHKLGAADSFLRVGTLTGGCADPSRDPGLGPGLVELELDVLASIATYPTQLRELRRWLRPEHFSSAPARALYQIVLNRHTHQQAIDPLTLAWLARAHGIADIDDTLMDLLSNGQPWGRYLAVNLHARATRRVALAVARQLPRLAAAPLLDAERLLEHLEQSLTDLLQFAGTTTTGHTTISVANGPQHHSRRGAEHATPAPPHHAGPASLPADRAA